MRSTIKILINVMFATVLLATAAPIASATVIAAHRGGGEVYPRQSMAAFERAAADGFQLEADAQLLTDGTAVVHHDQRLADGCSPYGGRTVTGLSWKQASRVRCNGRRLVQVIDLLRYAERRRAGLQLEVKEWGSSTAAARRHAAAVARLVDRYGNKRSVIIQSFGWRDVARSIQAVDHDLRVAALETSPSITGVRRAADLGLDYYSYHYSGNYGWLNSYIRSKGLVPSVWTVDKAADVAQAEALGAEVIISNKPRSARRAVQDRQCRRHWVDRRNAVVWKGTLRPRQGVYPQVIGRYTGPIRGITALTWAVRVSDSDGRGAIDLAGKNSWLGHSGSRVDLRRGDQRIAIHSQPGDAGAVRLTNVGPSRQRVQLILTGYSRIDC
ncbi:glycerophosphodiester phosphodiesterase family protein [Microlunatus soli]|uniref:Glycerophosphoryl diester phosphodiesterase n=1 Tax=Microlunatus soli TaxID=630515 RepID=A0A1H2A6U4_9ACTN|nr:glycerophosphodiester phosphodiesterase family protein [Microlunatus soli]SDT41680.1 Glycerophosphoryl diester phosphodiesterase [Microlunatus soli]